MKTKEDNLLCHLCRWFSRDIHIVFPFLHFFFKRKFPLIFNKEIKQVRGTHTGTKVGSRKVSDRSWRKMISEYNVFLLAINLKVSNSHRRRVRLAEGVAATTYLGLCVALGVAELVLSLGAFFLLFISCPSSYCCFVSIC